MEANSNSKLSSSVVIRDMSHPLGMLHSQRIARGRSTPGDNVTPTQIRISERELPDDAQRLARPSGLSQLFDWGMVRE